MIVVTGAGGRLGRLVADRLVRAGKDVVGTDRVPAESPDFKFVLGDLSDAGMVSELVRGADAVVHMGAIPGPRSRGQIETFENNVSSTFNVMMAAAEHKVRRIVFSSSAFGMGWAHDPSAFVPLYLPLDEDHPMMPFETYGLSKQIGEDIGAMLARSTDISVVSLRFTNIPHDEVRAEFPLPAPTKADPHTLVIWGYAFADDVAEAHVLAVDADIEGHEAFLLAQNKTRFSEPTVDLVRANFGDRVEIRDGLEGNASVISTLKAQRMLGWVPTHDWTRGDA
jgi:UDP-glucose 4-epimerase